MHRKIVNQKLNRIFSEFRKKRARKTTHQEGRGLGEGYVFTYGDGLTGDLVQYRAMGSCHPDSVYETFIFTPFPFGSNLKKWIVRRHAGETDSIEFLDD